MFVDALLEYQEDRKKGGPRVTIRAGKPKKNNISSVSLKKASEKHQDSKNAVTSEKKAGVKNDEVVFVGWLGRCCL